MASNSIETQTVLNIDRCCVLGERTESSMVPDFTASLLEVINNRLAQPLRGQSIQESHFTAMSLLMVHSSMS